MTLLQPELRDTLQRLIQEIAPAARERELSDDEPLVTGRILDSMSTLELVGRLEDEFGIAVDAHEVDVENFDDLRKIAAFLHRKRRDAGPTPRKDR